MEAQHRHLLIWLNFFSGLHGPLNHGQWRFEEINLIHQCFQGFLSTGSAERSFSQMTAQKLTYPKIVNIHWSQPLCECVYVWGRMCGLTYFLYQFPLDTLFQIMPVRHASWKSIISGFSSRCYSLDQLQSIVWGRNSQHALNMARVCQAIMMHVCPWIIGPPELISIQVRASGTDSRLGFSCSLA
jgi:hypothetical protein